MAKFTFTGLDSIQYQLQASAGSVPAFQRGNDLHNVGNEGKWNVEEVETEE